MQARPTRTHCKRGQAQLHDPENQLSMTTAMERSIFILIYFPSARALISFGGQQALALRLWSNPCCPVMHTANKLRHRGSLAPHEINKYSPAGCVREAGGDRHRLFQCTRTDALQSRHPLNAQCENVSDHWHQTTADRGPYARPLPETSCSGAIGATHRYFIAC
jgi:hypothetical protein